MTKSFKSFLELYQPKSADERKFADKHVVAKNPDRNGNSDDVFKGSTKKVDRKKDKHGHEPGEDEKVYEGTVNEYKIETENGVSRDDEGNVWGGKHGMKGYTGGERPHAVHIDGKKWKTFSSKQHALNVAKKIKNGKATVHAEQTETNDSKYIEEVLTASDPSSKWISDFVNSDNPKFAGKSKKERIKMALGAYYAAQKEEVDIDTLLSSLNPSNKKLMVSVFEKLTEENQKKFIEAVQKDLDAVLDFAIKNRGLE